MTLEFSFARSPRHLRNSLKAACTKRCMGHRRQCTGTGARAGPHQCDSARGNPDCRGDGARHSVLRIKISLDDAGCVGQEKLGLSLGREILSKTRPHRGALILGGAHSPQWVRNETKPHIWPAASSARHARPAILRSDERRHSTPASDYGNENHEENSNQDASAAEGAGLE